MIYITVKQSPIYHQMTIEELLMQDFTAPAVINPNLTNTKTYEVEYVSERFMRRLDVDMLIAKLVQFNQSVESLRQQKRSDLYETFYIPKKSGGLRRIDAPKAELMDALRRLKTILEEDFHVLYHTSAFAYVKKRCTVDAVKRHQANNSKWFGKLDLHDFFGSTTLDFAMSMLSKIFPISEVVKVETGRNALQCALELAFLNGGLPQGTPISPLITNVMMIPVDFKLANTLREFEQQKFVYTRYADDFIISSKYDFDPAVIEKLLVDTLSEFHAPFTINSAKTRYGSSAGRNWNLGLVLNKDNEITIGRRNKEYLKAACNSYVKGKKNGVNWDLHDVAVLRGTITYYKMVEPEYMSKFIAWFNEKNSVNLIKMLRDEFR